MRLYEALFLMDADLKPEPGHEEFLVDLLKKNGAKVVGTDRWGERKLAFEIRHKKRGLYFLIHFEADPLAVRELRRACHLAEPILRELILEDEDGIAKARAEALLGSPAPVEVAHG